MSPYPDLPSLAKLVRQVAVEFGVEASAIVAPDRGAPPVCKARQLVCYLAVRRMRWPISALGQQLSRRSWDAIAEAVQRALSLNQSDPQFRGHAAALEKSLNLPKP